MSQKERCLAENEKRRTEKGCGVFVLGNPLSVSTADKPQSASSTVDADTWRYVIFLERIDRGEVIVESDPRSPIRAFSSP